MATQPQEQEADTPEATEGAGQGGNDNGADNGGERDFEAEARQHGWTPKDEFKGDPEKWVDAETFVKRADEVMPFLKKQNAALKREIDDMKRDFKKAQKHFSAAEERAYTRAISELEKRHDEAVESGDVAESKRIRKEMSELKPAADEAKEIDPAQARKELNAWIEENDWYVLDNDKRKYADLQATLMGPAVEWEGGHQAYLDEIRRRTDRKFAEKKPSATNGGGNREGAKRGGKSFADLPPEAKRLCDKWVSNGLIKSRDDYVKSYDWS